MATEFKLPEVSEGAESATILSILVKEGDNISADQNVVEIETEKASLEIPAEIAGVVEKILVSEGDQVKIGDPVLRINENGDSSGNGKQQEEEAGKQQKEEADKKQDKKTEDKQDDKAKEKEKEKDKEKEDEEGGGKDKEKGKTEEEDTQSFSSSDSQARSMQQAAPAQVGAAHAQPSNTARIENVPAAPAPSMRPNVPAAPSVRRFAREIGIDITQVKGSGPGGRISHDDIKAHAKQINRGGGAAAGIATSSPAAAELPDFSQWGEVHEEKLGNVGRVMSQRMAQSWAMVPHVHHYDYADISQLEKLRKEYNDRLKDDQPKLTVTAIIVRVLALLLKKYPRLNASLDAANNTLILKDYVHIGIAVDSPSGLLVPVLRDADKKSVQDIVAELDEIAGRARDGKMRPDEMKGGTFTVSNLGGIGGASFNPIVNFPEVAILGVARARYEKVWDKNGEESLQFRLPLTLAYDHRVVDGAQGARFTRGLAAYLSNPLHFMLEL